MRKRNVLVAAGACLAALTLMAPTAFADPAGTKLLAGVGSDTTETIMNQMAGVIPSIGSYDASTNPPGNITTKAPIAGSTCTIPRPVGSNAGVQALVNERNAAAVAPIRRPCLDFARASTNNSAMFAGSGLTWVPFAVDGITIVTPNNSPLTTNFTIAFLKALYSCTLPSAVQSQYRPLIPQAGSGTRSFFLTAIGATLNLAVAQGGTCASPGAPSALDSNGNPLLENHGNLMQDPRNVEPYSIADYMAQSSGAVNDVSGNTKMRRINGVIPVIADPNFPLRRAVYNVIPTVNATQPDSTGVNAGTDPNYGPVFVGNKSSICMNTGIIRGNGFGTLTAGDPVLPPGNTGCGDVISVTSTGPGVVTGPPST